MHTLLGSFHQGNDIFGENAGYQCTAMALSALILASIVPVSEWSLAHLDETLLFGDSLFTSVIDQHYGGRPVYLMPVDLPTSVEFMSHQFILAYTMDTIHGIVSYDRNDIEDGPFLAQTLRSGMEVGLSESNFILLTIGQMTVGVVYDTLTDTYWVFDSHARGAYGEPLAFGKAALITFSTLHELLTYLHTNYSNLIYNLTPVNILQRLEQFQREHDLRNQSRSDEWPKSDMTSDSTLKLDNYIGGNIAQAGNFDVAEPSIPPSSIYMHHSYPMGQCIAATPFSGFTEVSDSCATHTLSNAVTDTNLQNSELILNHTYIKSSLSFDNRRHNLHSNYYHRQSTSDNGESFPDQNLDSSMLTQNTFACLDSHEVASHNEEPVIHTNRLINDSLCLQSVCPLPNYFHFSNQSCSNVIAPTSVIPPHCLQQDQSPNDFSLCECEALDNRMELISNASKSKNVSPCFITGICQYPSQRCTCCECFIWPKM